MWRPPNLITIAQFTAEPLSLVLFLPPWALREMFLGLLLKAGRWPEVN